LPQEVMALRLLAVLATPAVRRVAAGRMAAVMNNRGPSGTQQVDRG
jgi:hypothetical protein